MILSFLLCLFLPLTRCCSGTCFWKSLGNSWRVRGPWSMEKSLSVLIGERAWCWHNLQQGMPHWVTAIGRQKKCSGHGTRGCPSQWWFCLQDIQAVSMQPQIHRAVICPMVPVPDLQTKAADLRLACKDVGRKWTTKWKWALRKGAIIAFTWSISLPSGSSRYFYVISFFTNIPLDSRDFSAKEILQWPQTNPSCCVSNHAPKDFQIPNLKSLYCMLRILQASNIRLLLGPYWPTRCWQGGTERPG